MKTKEAKGTVYFRVSFMPFGRRLPSAFPEVVHECRDPSVSIAIGRLPRLMRKFGYGRYSVLAVSAPGEGRHRFVLSAVFADPADDEVAHSPHCCPQCQEARKALRQSERERSIPGAIERAQVELAELSSAGHLVH